jgi:ApeA N-terminal domain 1
MHEHTLDQPFVAEGQFWLPAMPEQRIAGTLNYSLGSITVNLIGDPGAIGTESLLRDDAGVRELVLGSTRVGSCALWNAFITSSSTTYGPDDSIGVATYRANRLYVGKAYESVDAIEFEDFVVGFDVLPTWLGHDPFGMTEPGSDALHRYAPFPPVAAVIPEEELQIELSTPRRSGRRISRVHMGPRGVVRDSVAAAQEHRVASREDGSPSVPVERRLTAQKLKAFLFFFFFFLLSRLDFRGEDVKERYPMSRWGWASRS